MATTETRLQGKIAIITGASSGLGWATALRYAACGARVVCADLQVSTPSIETVIHEQYGAEAAIFVRVNVTDEESVSDMIQRAVAWAGRLDIICNYAGISTELAGEAGPQRIHETSVADFDRTMAVNVRGLWLCCKYAIIQMLAQEPRAPNARGEQTRGWIINAASIYGLVGVFNTPCYVPSKHAVVGLTKSLAIDYAKDRIHANALCPGFVRTPLLNSHLGSVANEQGITALHPWGAIGTPEDIADAAVFLASDEAAWITGHNMVIDGGYTCQ